MSFYSSASWKFWILVFIGCSLVLYGIMCDNDFVLMSGLLLGLVLIPYSAHVFIKDNFKRKS